MRQKSSQMMVKLMSLVFKKVLFDCVKNLLALLIIVASSVAYGSETKEENSPVDFPEIRGVIRTLFDLRSRPDVIGEWSNESLKNVDMKIVKKEPSEDCVTIITRKKCGELQFQQATLQRYQESFTAVALLGAFVGGTVAFIAGSILTGGLVYYFKSDKKEKEDAQAEQHSNDDEDKEGAEKAF
jgi:hypothetical protein